MEEHQITGENGAAGDIPSSSAASEGAFMVQMGTVRRDSKVVCETLGSESRHCPSPLDPLKSLKHCKRGAYSYSHSRNSLLSCFMGDSVMSPRAMSLRSNCDSAGTQRAFWSLIPVDNSRVNERTGDPTSPQLSCIGQVKCRQAKQLPTYEMAQVDSISEVNEVMELSRFGPLTCKGRTRSFDLTLDDIPPLDLNEGPDSPKLIRTFKRCSSMTCTKKGNKSQTKHSLWHLNHVVKQFLGASFFKSGWICGFKVKGSTMVDEGDSVAEHYEIDLSRFASCDTHAKTPSFRESRYQIGKKLANIRVRSQDEKHRPSSDPKESEPPTIVIKVERRDSSSQSALWKRRSMERPLSLEVKR